MPRIQAVEKPLTGFSDKFSAVCCAHSLFAYGEQLALRRAKSRLRRLRSAQRCGARLTA